MERWIEIEERKRRGEKCIIVMKGVSVKEGWIKGAIEEI